VRLDLFLKNTGIIPRRSVAKEACDQQLIEIDGKAAKASSEVRVGNIITTRIGLRVTRHEVLQVPQRAVPKSDRDAYCRLISSERVQMDL